MGTLDDLPFSFSESDQALFRLIVRKPEIRIIKLMTRKARTTKFIIFCIYFSFMYVGG